MPRKKITEENKQEKDAEETAKEIGKEVKEIAENIVEAVKEEIKELAGEEEEKKETARKGKREKKKEEKKAKERIEGEEKKEGKKEEEEKIKERKITKKELEERAKKLAENIKEEDVKKKLGEEREKAKKEKGKTLVPIEDYVKYGCYIGTKVITPHMRQYVYRRRNDGIAIINTNLIDEKLKKLIELLVKYNPQDFIIACKREAGWKAVETFARLTGVRIFTKKYPAGILTNLKLPSFFETEMVFICDPWMDRNAMNDAKKIKKPVFALCDTNNYTFDIDFLVPVNNKSGKSMGLIFYILSREYLKAKKIDKEVKIEDFEEEEQFKIS